MARAAARQAQELRGLQQRVLRLQVLVMATVGGTATGSDRAMVRLLEESAEHAKRSADAFDEARRAAEEAARRAEQEQAAAKSSAKGGRR